MSQKIIKPKGIELIEYLSNGYEICNKCGALMDRNEDPAGACDILTCPSCGWTIDEMEYEYEYDEDVEYTSEILNVYGGDVSPAGCGACGGPYPYCKTSCKLFDD